MEILFLRYYYFTDEDEDIKMTVHGGSSAGAIKTMNRAIAAKILDLRTCSSLICIFLFYFFLPVIGDIKIKRNKKY